MRTTVNIEDELLRQARAKALATGRSLGDIVNDALRADFATRARGDAIPVDIPTYGRSGLQPGVDLEDKAALADLLDAQDETHAAG